MRVIALEKFEYANVLRHPGDEFTTTSEKDADILILAKRVKKKPDAPPPEKYETRDVKAEQPEIDHSRQTRPNKREYKRRDMVSEK